MTISGNTILITGGATGIGLALAEALLDENNTVLICGRRVDKLAEARQRFPRLHVFQADIGTDQGRRKLAACATQQFPGLNVLINNAGIQREIDFANSPDNLLRAGDSEIAINFEGPVHLTALLMPHLRSRPEAAVVNVTSGLGFAPLTLAPVYSATKAALHSFSMSLRHQLRATPVRVFEVIPPIVETDLDQGARVRRGQTACGVAPKKVALATVAALRHDRYEVPVV